MNEKLDPETVHPPLAKYSHTVKVPPAAAWVAVSGQLGIAPDGRLAEGVEGQSEQALRNILACLEAHGMGAADLVKLTIYLTDARGVGAFREARAKVLGDDVRPTSTLLIITGLAAPEYLVEIEAWAAKG